MTSFLNEKTALVTGGSRGIGFAIAEALLIEGAKVLICGRDEQSLTTASTALTRHGKVLTHIADVSNPTSVESLFQAVDSQLGQLDILINNAGVGIFRAAGELTVEEWNRVIGINLSGAFYCARQAIQRMQDHRGGWIINISSLAGKNPFSGGSAYNASKFGLNGFSEAAMMDHRSDDIRVSYVMPGSVDTGFGGHASENRSSWKIAPEDVAQIVLSILRMPERTLISRVEVRPSRPQKN
jgi:NAD(P)-dependent dehydrogenase (short-subunit alcohol dehydrogenase family)